MFKSGLACAGLLLLMGGGAAQAQGGDATSASLLDLEPGFPTRLQDAEVTPHHVWQVEAPGYYEWPRQTRSRFVFDPVLKLGVAPKMHIFGGGEFYSERVTGQPSGFALVGLLYQINSQTPNRAGQALGVRANIPFDHDDRGTDVTFTYAVSRELSNRYTGHVNGEYTRVVNGVSGIRTDRFSVIGGLSRMVDDKTIGVVDGILESGIAAGDELNSGIELGLRRVFHGNSTISAGLRFGVGGENRSDVTVLFGFSVRH